MFLKNMNNFNVYLTSLIGFTAIVGDLFVTASNLNLFRALFDNATHGVIGGLSWLVFALNSKLANAKVTSLEVLLCAVLSSAIDLDHFVVAKSLLLKDATNLTRRPFLHCSTFPLSASLILLLVSYLLSAPCIKRISLMTLTAFGSHHIRDATRRGFWFYPYGSTPPIPYMIYVLLTCVWPYFVLFVNSYIVVGSQNYEKYTAVI
ncbi:transmembrane protein 267 [Cylas formicarius]|uniref:transmembrane protein 267 n=1 Tax=Cylas formicarius TaxID=197179 RepID=UPI002958C3FF|nr:transmembrane protein 267 [Cylas formicarius]